jgi:FkbM family methyltransferase
MIELQDVAMLGRSELEDRCRAQAQSAFLGDNTTVCRVLGRFKFFVDNRDYGFGCHLLLDGFWEIWLTQFFARYVKPGMRVVDVGANYGYYTVLFGDLVGPGGYVHAIEPNPAAVAFLKNSVRHNGFAERTCIHQIAVGASEGKATLCVPNGDPKNGHLLPVGEDGKWGYSPVHEVKRMPLDRLLSDETAVDFVKIDAEGSEADIIAGMEQVIRKFQPAIVLEFNTARYDNPAAFFAKLSAPYSKVRLVGDDGNLKPLDTAEILREKVNRDWLLFLSNDDQN